MTEKNTCKCNMVTPKQHTTVVDSPWEDVRTHMQTDMPTHRVERVMCRVGDWKNYHTQTEIS